MTQSSCCALHGPISRLVSSSSFFTNHMRVLAALVRRPDLRLWEVAAEVGVTERAAHRLVSDLVGDGFLSRERHGSRNRYAPLRPLPLGTATAELIRSALEPVDAGAPSVELPD